MIFWDFVDFLQLRDFFFNLAYNHTEAGALSLFIFD